MDNNFDANYSKGPIISWLVALVGRELTNFEQSRDVLDHLVLLFSHNEMVDTYMITTSMLTVTLTPTGSIEPLTTPGMLSAPSIQRSLTDIINQGLSMKSNIVADAVACVEDLLLPCIMTTSSSLLLTYIDAVISTSRHYGDDLLGDKLRWPHYTGLDALVHRVLPSVDTFVGNTNIYLQREIRSIYRSSTYSARYHIPKLDQFLLSILQLRATLSLL
jgi:hypothetical protein